MSDNMRTPTAKEVVARNLQWSSDSDESNSAGSNGYFELPPRPWGRRGRRGLASAKRNHESGSDKENDKEGRYYGGPSGDRPPTDSRGYYPEPSHVASETYAGASSQLGEAGKRAKLSKRLSESSSESDNPENDPIPPLQPIDEEGYFPDDSDLEDGSSSNASTIPYGANNLRYSIGVEGIVSMDLPVRTDNTLAAAIGNILQSKVSHKCGCNIENSRPYDPVNLAKTFASNDKSLQLSCSVPTMCNKIDITGANYCAEREKTGKEIINLRNRAINFGTEEHFYLGIKISQYKDFLESGDDILLYAVMGGNRKDLRLINKNAPPIPAYYKPYFARARAILGEDKAPRRMATNYIPDDCERHVLKIEKEKKEASKWRNNADPKLHALPSVEMYSTKCIEKGCYLFHNYKYDVTSVRIYNPILLAGETDILAEARVTNGIWGMAGKHKDPANRLNRMAYSSDDNEN